MIEYNKEIREVYEIFVPHNIFELFCYEDENGINKSTHYGIYHLYRLIQDMEDTDYDLTQEEKDFIYEVYNFCEEKYDNIEPLTGKGVVFRFLDEDF